MPHLIQWSVRLSWGAYAKASIVYCTSEGIPHTNKQIIHVAKQLRFITVSRSVQEWLSKAGITSEGYCPHAWDPDEKDGDPIFARTIREPFKEKFLVGYCGSPIKRKGLAALGEAAKIIYDRGFKNIHFLIWTQHWQDCIIPEGPNITFLDYFGAKDHKQVMGFYQALDLYVQPSHAEGSCIPLLEAQAMSKACVCVNKGPMGEWVQEDRGYLVPVQEIKLEDHGLGQDFVMYYYKPEDLAERILEAYNDQEGLKNRSAKAGEYALNYTYDKVYIPLVRRI
jgi:glycosyltransferase involved in cell wall biosynthesis